MKTFLDSLSVAKQLTRTVLKEADGVFPHQRQQMCQQYHLRNGIFGRS